MIARINKDGQLLIQRRGLWKKAWCPFVSEAVECGDHCPHFKEETDGGLRLTCGKASYFDTTKDARPEPTVETLGIPQALRCQCAKAIDFSKPGWEEKTSERYRIVASYKNLQLLAPYDCKVCGGSGLDPCVPPPPTISGVEDRVRAQVVSEGEEAAPPTKPRPPEGRILREDENPG